MSGAPGLPPQLGTEGHEAGGKGDLRRQDRVDLGTGVCTPPPGSRTESISAFLFFNQNAARARPFQECRPEKLVLYICKNQFKSCRNLQVSFKLEG